MTALERVATDVAQSRQGIRAALAFVASVSNEDQAADAYDRIKLAKEWAKIRKITEEVSRDLLRLEIHCLRKIAQLGSLGIIPAQHRASALFFADKSDEEIEALIQKFGAGASPIAVYRRQQAKQEYDDAHDWAAGLFDGYRPSDGPQYPDPDLTEAAARYGKDLKAALAAIVADYGSGDDEFSIHEMARRLCESIGLDETSAYWGAQEGMREVCRRAIREAPTVIISGTRAPKFITCYRSESQDYIRVPFHSATLYQLQQMVDLKQAQAADAESAARELEYLLKEFQSAVLPADGSHAEHSVPLGDLAMRMASADRKYNRVVQPAFDSMPETPPPLRIGQTPRSAAMRRRKSA